MFSLAPARDLSQIIHLEDASPREVIQLFQDALPLLSPSVKLFSASLACENSDKIILENLWKKKFRFTSIPPVINRPIIATPLCEAASRVLSNTDLLREILSNIDALSLVSLRSVSQRWNRVIGTVPAQLRIHSLTPEHSSVVTSFPKLRGLTIEEIGFGQSGLIFALLPGRTELRSLRLPSLHAPYEIGALTHLTELESLSMVYLPAAVDFSFLRHLTRLECLLTDLLFTFGAPAEPDRSAFDFACFSSLANLVSLQFSASAANIAREVRNLDVVSSLRHLKHLDLPQHAHLLTTTPDPLLARLTKLRSVTLAAPVAGIRLPYLHTLQLESLGWQAEQAAPLSSADLPALQNLVLKGSGVSSLKELHHLTKLTVDCLLRRPACPSFSRLEVLVIGFGGMNENLMKELPILPALRVLNVCGLSPRWSTLAPNLTSLQAQISHQLSGPEWNPSSWATSLQSLSIGMSTGAVSSSAFSFGSVPASVPRLAVSLSWLQVLTSLRSLVLDCDFVLPRMTALVNLRELACPQLALTPVHLTVLKDLPELRKLRVGSFREHEQLAKAAHEHLPYVRISCSN